MVRREKEKKLLSWSFIVGTHFFSQKEGEANMVKKIQILKVWAMELKMKNLYRKEILKRRDFTPLELFYRQ